MFQKEQKSEYFYEVHNTYTHTHTHTHTHIHTYICIHELAKDLMVNNTSEKVCRMKKKSQYRQ